jgi:taurine dioxygenase
MSQAAEMNFGTENAEAAPYTRLTVRRMCGALGAEIGGVDLSKPVDDVTVEEIRRAFLEFCVIVFRDQDLAPDRLIAFTEMFGTVEQHPYYRTGEIEGFPEILVLEHKAGQFFNGKNDVWHSDITFGEKPPLGSVLHCRACWEGFADTMFANQYMAYERLSDPMKRFLEGLTAEHSAAWVQRRNNERPNNKPITEIAPPVFHPVIRTHPETGRKSLYVNMPSVARICELEEEESKSILAFLYEHAVQPAFVYRHRWRVGDVAMFDNRCLMHYVVPDHPHDMHRLMHRTTAAGDKPF